MNDSLASYWNTPGVSDARASFCFAGGPTSRETVNV